MVEEGLVTIEAADQLFEASGFKMGPFKLMDLIGNDVNYAVSCSVYEQMNKNERFKPSYLQEQKVKEGKLGRKSVKVFINTINYFVKANILVTGGTGFLGSYIIKQLVEKGYTVRAIRRSAKLPFWIPDAIFNKVEWVEGDVLDIVALEDAMEGVDTVIHSAAIVSFAKKDRKEMYKVNVDGTANVVNVALEKNVRRLVHISSVAALGRTANGGHVNEEKKWEESKVNTHYAISKFKAELQTWRGLNEGWKGLS